MPSLSQDPVKSHVKMEALVPEDSAWGDNGYDNDI